MAKSNAEQALPNRIRYFRERQGLTLEDVAAESGLSVSYVSRLETNARNLSLKSLDKVARVLGVPASVLIAEPGSLDAAAFEASPEVARRIAKMVLDHVETVRVIGRIGEKSAGDDVAVARVKRRKKGLAR